MSSLKNVLDLEEYGNQEFVWDQHPTDPMSFVVYHHGKPVMCLFLGEAIESAGYKHVMEHVNECNNTPWLKRWQQEKNEALIDLITKEY